ncbi:MAG: dihydrolipoamide acetyltransferase family protein [Bacteroidota bacterium]|nr:dihydrolipoamide acetyltransferase family protein [Bacteroidota bacterium]MDP4211900.1 dihydrolipoamide acetyltransferase family protein [Bacteroidota bacterium]MDP4248511.1 dihydrolipoamide acetyltransferase family protein [Bacteroidota bacterium]
MAIVDLLMPKMGESIMEATILKWHKHPGDTVKQDESLLDIATDKVDSEVPSTTAGVLEEILFQVNDVVPVGAVIARIKTEVAEPVPDEVKPSVPEERETPVMASHPDQAPDAVKSNGNRFYSPLVLNIAGNEGISVGELEKIPGTGNEGRVTKRDILQYVTHKKESNGSFAGSFGESAQSGFDETQPYPGAAPETSGKTPDAFEYSAGGNVEIQEMDRMRRLIADHMVRSKHTSPHVTSFSEADVTNLVTWREKEKADFEKREGTKLTLTPLFIEALVKCIKKYPLINSSLQGDKIIIRKDIHIGMATALPSGSLIVPVIKYADNFNRVGLARQVNMLANQARNNKLKPEDIQDGTFTLTNVGVFGSLMGTPIINQPQVAILAVGAIKKRPVVIETEQGDAIGIRHMMYLSMSYDHRIIDGSLGATFLSAVAKELEAFTA